MNSVSCLEIMHALLVDMELVTNPQEEKPWPGYIGTLPDIKKPTVSFFDIAIATQGRLQKTRETVGFEGVQIRVTANNYVIARTKAFEIANALDTVVRYEVPVDNDQYRIEAVHRSMQPIYIGQDENDRDSFTMDTSFISKKVS